MLVWINAQKKKEYLHLKVCTETMFGCSSNHWKTRRHHQSIIKVLQHLIFLIAETAPMRQISGSRIHIVKARHHGTWSGSPSCFTTQRIAEKCTFIEINAPKHASIHCEAGGKTNIEHTGPHSHSQGTGCKSKACYMQTDQGKSGALRMRRKIVREFITRERGTLVICVSFKSIFFL